MTQPWYVKQGERTSGPYSWDELRYLAQRGKLTPDARLRSGEAGDWIAAASVAGLGLAGAASPDQGRAKSAARSAAEERTSPAPPPLKSESKRLHAPPPLSAALSMPPPLPKDSGLRKKLIVAIGGGTLLLGLLLLVLLAVARLPAAHDADGASARGGADAGLPASKLTSGDSKATPADRKQSSSSDARRALIAEAPAKTAAAATSPSDASGTMPSPAVKRVRTPRDDAVIHPLADDPRALLGDGKSDKALAGGSSEFFEIRAQGGRFIYVVDCSQSMQPERFARASKELLESIEALKPTQSFFVIFFATEAYPQCYPNVETKLAQATKSNKRRIAQWVGGFAFSGGTDPSGALAIALALEPDAIYLLSDGEFDPEIADNTSSLNVRRIPIHTLAFMDPVAAPVLGRIAQESGGTHRFVP